MPHRLARCAAHTYKELGSGQRSALLSWLAFTVTFAGLRGFYLRIRAGKRPFRNISIGGEHLHHYVWGIGLLSAVGAVAVRGEERHRRHPAIAVSYGSGPALIVDDFALLLDLRDVYSAKQGRISCRRSSVSREHKEPPSPRRPVTSAAEADEAGERHIGLDAHRVWPTSLWRSCA